MPMLILADAAVLLAMLIVLVRLLRGPTPFDRTLAGNSFGTKTVLLIALSGFLTGRPDFLDLAIVYALVNFIGTLALLRYSRYRSFGQPTDREEGRP